MSNRIKNNLKNLVGQTLNQYYSKVKPTISDLRYKQEYQNRIIECMVGEVDDNYVTTPETDNPIVKLEHSKEGVIKIPQIKGKTILLDADGNETDTPGEGCRLVSVGEDEDNKFIILSKNKNIFDENQTPVEQSDLGNWVRTFYPKPNTEYIYSSSPYTGHVTIKFYDINDKVISGISIPSNTTFVTPSDCKYAKTHTANDSLVQIELGNRKTEYVPHKSHKTEILLNKPLRGLPNGVCDEIVGNKIIRRVGIRIFDGSENWNGGLVSDNLFRCHTYDFDGVKHNGLISNIFAENHWEKGFYIHPHKLVYCTIENVTSVAEFKEWMSIKKPTLLYELAEPITEELPNSITLQGFDDTTMYIENSITPTVSYGYNALIPYKQELLNQQEEVEVNTLDIENNIIPYLMDMEYNLMLMEDN